MKLAALGIFLIVVSAVFGGCKSDPPDPPDPPAAKPQLSAARSVVSVLTQHNDNARTGQNLRETILTPSNVNVASFGQLGKLPVTGGVDAEPLYVPQPVINGAARDVLYVATEHGMVYAFDADALGPPLWQASVIPAGETPSDDQNCAQVTPEIGITATPVIDPHAGPNGTIFVVTMSKDSAGKYHQRLHALDLVTHAELDGGPVEIQASYASLSGPIAFDPRQYEARSALLLVNGEIYMGWSSHCDAWPYTGWIMAYSESTLRQTSVLNLTPNGSAGAIWMSGGGMAADSAGSIFLLDGNGTFDPKLDAAGMPVNGDFGNTFLKLSAKGNALRVADYFAPHDTILNSNQDRDLGSGGLLLLPDLKDSRGITRHLAVGAGKANFRTGKAVIYVVNRDAMGKFDPHSDQAIYQKISNGLGGTDGVFALPAYFNNTVYYGAQGDYLKAFPISCAKLAARAASHSPTKFAYPGATPSISADGTKDGVVWAVEAATPGVLHAYDAANLANELYNSNQASGGRDQFVENKFITPMIANGKVYIGTPDSVVVFGLLNSTGGGLSREAHPNRRTFAAARYKLFVRNAPSR
ncbi:MAG: pyrrolo-quinoline quinone [Candidatus Acidiferrales bacterium]